jgi:predicted transport protein
MSLPVTNVSTGARLRVPVSFEDHVAYADPSVRPVLRELRMRIKALDQNGRKITEQVTIHQRVAYSVARIFAELKVQKKRILVRFFGMNVPDPKNLVTKIPATHGWQHDKQIAVDSLDLIDYVMTFIEASYRSRLTTMPAQ